MLYCQRPLGQWNHKNTRWNSQLTCVDIYIRNRPCIRGKSRASTRTVLSPDRWYYSTQDTGTWCHTGQVKTYSVVEVYCIIWVGVTWIVIICTEITFSTSQCSIYGANILKLRTKLRNCLGLDKASKLVMCYRCLRGKEDIYILLICFVWLTDWWLQISEYVQ